MGLSLHYTLSLPADTPHEEVVHRLRDLHGRIAELPVTLPFPLADHGPGSGLRDEPVEERFWSEFHFPVTRETWSSVGPLELVAFLISLARGAEPAFIALAKYPRTAVVDGRRIRIPGPRGRWFYRWACKTQYAAAPAAGGIENFLLAHLSLVAALDLARASGIKVDVDDEGRYWASRDPTILIRELHRLNHLVAVVAGKISDRLGSEAVHAPIKKRPDFECLEAAATKFVRSEIADERVRKLIRRTARL